MNYKLRNFQIKQANGSHIQGQSTQGYLSCNAYNPMNRFEKSHNIVIFDQGTVEHYRSVLPVSRGGLLPDENWSEEGMDPMDKIFINGITVEYQLGGLYCRKYTNDIVDANGVVIPGKSKGNIICDQNGLPIVFDKIPVFCQYEFKTEPIMDEYGMPKLHPETGNPMSKIIRDANGMPIESWVDGWSPMAVGESMRRLLTPYTTEMQARVLEQTGIDTNPHNNISVSASELFEEQPTLGDTVQQPQQPMRTQA